MSSNAVAAVPGIARGLPSRRKSEVKISSEPHVHILMATDNNYVPPTAVVLSSLAQQTGPDKFFIHIGHHSVHPDRLERLRVFAEGLFPGRVRLVKTELDDYKHFRLDEHITPAAYIRLFLADLVPDHVRRVIYLDSDLIVRTNIEELWHHSLDGCILAAAPEVFSPLPERLGLVPDAFYFNSGVMLIDASQWRAIEATPRLLSFVAKNSKSLRYHDQDALNAVLGEMVKPLSYEWNFQARTDLTDLRRIGLDTVALREARRTARIVHFTTGAKPWLYYFDTPFETEYIKYARRTPWASAAHQDKTTRARLRRLVKRYVPTFASTAKWIGGPLERR